MKNLIFLITLFIIAVIVSPSLMTLQDNNGFFNYTITGCAETLEGTATRSIIQEVNPSIKLINDSITYERGAVHLCCRQAIMNYTINNNIINLYEEWNGPGCRCQCYTDLKATIKNINHGTYVVNVYKTGNATSGEAITPLLLITETVTYPGPGSS